MWPSLTTPTENTSKGGKGPISLSSLVHIWFSSFLQQPKQNCFSFQTTIAISEMSVIWGNLQDTCWQCISKSPWVPLDHFCEVIRFLTIQFHPEYFSYNTFESVYKRSNVKKLHDYFVILLFSRALSPFFFQH